MNKSEQETQLNLEIKDFLYQRMSLQLATIDDEGIPHASYAPYAIGEQCGCFYILISDIAQHASNLKANGKASVLIIEDEESANELFARVRLTYNTHTSQPEFKSPAWEKGIKKLQERHGDRVEKLARLSDFNLFKLCPRGGRYVKGFGQAYSIASHSLSAGEIKHLRDGHKKRA